MERKDAIERLKQLRLDYTEFWEEIKNETTEALDMAIASLETDESYQLEYELTTKNDLSSGLKNGSPIIDWNNCHTSEQLDSIATTKNDLGVDCIDRAELLKAMDTWDKFGYTETGCFVRAPKNDYVPYVHYDDMVNCVKGMPPVTTQESKTGHWIEVHPLQEDDGGAYMCSKCRCGHPYIAPHWKYCPNCGARMVEPQESEA